MHHLLVAVDGSDSAQTAARYGLDLARASGRELVALAVFTPEALSALGETTATAAFSSHIPEGEQIGRRAVREWFDQTEGLCDQAGVCFSRRVDAGDPAERLAWAAMTAHLCVFGAHGSHAVLPHSPGRGLGKTAAHLVQRAVKPMLIVRGEYRPIKRVVLGWDEHSSAAHAAEMVAEFGKADAWEVKVVSGTRPTTSVADSCGRIADALDAEGLPAEAQIVEGDAPQVLFDAVGQFTPDLLVLGGHPPARGLLSEAPWLQVVEQVQVPVLLYR